MSDTGAQPREIEAKYEIDQAGRDALASATQIGSFAVTRRRERHQDDTYYDTRAGHLKRVDASLRIRRLADGALMTYKGERVRDEHVVSRLEDEVPISPTELATITDRGPLPANLELSPTQRARALATEAELVPTARLRNQRTILDLMDDQGHTVELAIDACEGTRLSDGRTVRFEELEAELKNGDRDALTELEQALRRLVPSLQPNRRTKLERTLDE
jgi:inorganic triphosphatase YgiF